MPAMTHRFTWPLRLVRASVLGLFFTVCSLFLSSPIAHAAGNYTVSGTFLTNAGAVPGFMAVQLSQNGQVVSDLAINRTTGAYSITVPAGSYTIGFTNNFSDPLSSTGPAGTLQCNYPCGNTVDLTSGNQTVNFTLNLVAVTVTLEDQFGQPLANAPVTAAGIGTVDMGQAGTFTGVSMGIYSNINYYTVKTNAAGVATIYLPAGLMYSDVYAYPTAGGRVDYTGLGNLTQSTSITMQQLPPSTFTGTVEGANGTPVYNATIYLEDAYANTHYFKTTSTNGVFSFSVPADVYSLYYAFGANTLDTNTMPPSEMGVPAGASLPTVDLSSGGLSENLSFNLVPITVNVVTASGGPLANAGVTAAGSGPVTISPLGAINSVMGSSSSWSILPQTNVAGQTTVYLPMGINITSISACVNNISTCNLFSNTTPFTVTGPTSVTVQQPPQNTFSGTFLDALGQPVSGAFGDLQGNSLVWNFTTNSQGQYSVNANPGVYDVSISFNRSTTGANTGMPPASVDVGPADSATVDLTSSNVTENFNLDLTQVTATVRDVNGNLLANSAVIATGQGSLSILPGESATGEVSGGPLYVTNATTPITPVTNSQGIVQLYLPAGIPYTLTAYQPETRANQTLASIASTSINTLTGNESVTLQQTYSYSGTVTDNQGNAVQGATVTLSSGTGLNYSAVTASNGSFTVNSTAGNFTVSVIADSANSAQTSAIPGTFNSGPGPTVDMTANTTQNLVIPDAPVTVTVLNRYGNAAAGIPVSITGSGSTSLYPGGTFANASVSPTGVQTTTNSSGQIVVNLPTGLNYSAITASFANDTATGTIGNLTGATSLTIQEPYTLSGTVTDTQSNPVEGAQVSITNPTTGVQVASATTSAQGTYSTPLALGTYNIAITPPNGSNLSPATFNNYTTADDATLNATLQPAYSVLTGHVVDGSNAAINGVLVQVVQQSNHSNVLGSATTDSNGNYTIDVTPAVYDVIFTPSGNTYLPLTKTGVDLTSNATLDVALVLAPRTFSGKVLDRNNVAVQSASITLASTTSSQTYTTGTASDGSFSLQVNPGTYVLTVFGSSFYSPLSLVPERFNITGGELDLTSNFNQNLTIQAVTETYTTTNSVTNATVGDVSLGISAESLVTLFPGGPLMSDQESLDTTTGSNGTAPVVMLSGTRTQITANPPSDSGVVTTSFPQAGPYTSDGSVTLPLTGIVYTFSGTITDNASQPVNGAAVQLGAYRTTTLSNGNFSLQVAPGAYRLQLSGQNGSSLMPGTFNFAGPTIDLTSGNVQQNLVIPTTAFQITVEDPSGIPLEGFSTGVACQGSTTIFGTTSSTGIASSTASTGQNGTVTLLEATGMNNCNYVVTGSGGFVTTSGTFTNTDNAYTIIMNRLLDTYQGMVTDKNDIGVSAATVKLTGPEPDEQYSAVTLQDGSFTMQVAPVSYSLVITGTAAAAPQAFVPDNFTLSGGVTITGNQSQNFLVDCVTDTIVSQDTQANSIPSVAINFSSAGTTAGFASSSTNITRNTGTQGQTSVVMLEGTTYTINATPPSGTGFVATTFNGTSPITNDTTTVIQFQQQIPAAPTGLTAPSPTNLPVLTWNPVSGADHYNIYRDSVDIGSSTTATYTDSTATNGTHMYSVTAVGTTGYESLQSTPVTVLVDTTPPTITYTLTPVADSNGNNTGNVLVTFTCSDPGGSGIASCSSPVTVGDEGIGQTVTGTATDNAGNTTTINPSASLLVTAISAGGPAVSYFSADTNFTGGQTYSSSAAVDTSNITIPAAAPQSVYQNSRYGTNFSYSFPGLTPNTTYTLRLDLNELYWTAPGSRVFNVAVNGQTELSNLDIFQQAGGENRAIAEQIPATADANGNVMVTFTGDTDNALVNGLELYTGTLPPAPPVPTITSAAINAGGPAVGNFSADNDFSDGSTYSSTAPVDLSQATSPAPQAVYQTVRYGNFNYTVSHLAASTNFLVRLHFNELYWGAINPSGGVGSRVFNVSINGTQVLTNFDVFQAAGGANKALVEEFVVPSDAYGNVSIQFTSVTDNAMVSGIEILPPSIPTPTYFTANDGTNFTRSTSPFTTGPATQSVNADGSITTTANSSGYADSGFALYEGTLGNLPNFTTIATGDHFGLNIWFDEDADNEFFNWGTDNILSSLGGDTYGLTSGSTNGQLQVNGTTQLYMTSSGQSYSLADLRTGALAGISSNTPVAVWIGVSTTGTSTSSTIQSVDGL